MSRTIRRLPTGHRSKKNRYIGYYNPVRSFDTSVANLLRNPPSPPPARSLTQIRYGLWLKRPRRGYYYQYEYDYYRDEDYRYFSNSISGPRWVDAEDFHHPDIQFLINNNGWTYDKKTKKKQTGPESWNYETIDLGPDFKKTVVHRLNPNYNEEADDVYREWCRAHRIVVRNGHYKDHHPGYAKFKRREKQADHQVERSRRAAALRKLVAETLIERAIDLAGDALPHGVELGEEVDGG